MIVFTDNAPAVAPLDPQPMLAALHREAVILQARGTAFGEQVYVCARGRRHPIVSAGRLQEPGFRWPEDVQQVSERLLASYAPAGGIPAPRIGRPTSARWATRWRSAGRSPRRSMASGSRSAPAPVRFRRRLGAA